MIVLKFATTGTNMIGEASLRRGGGGVIVPERGTEGEALRFRGVTKTTLAPLLEGQEVGAGHTPGRGSHITETETSASSDSGTGNPLSHKTFKL